MTGTHSLCFTLAFLIPILSSPAYADDSVTIVIDSGKHGPVIHESIYSVHIGVWDTAIFPGTLQEALVTADQAFIRRLMEAHIPILKYPGGNFANEWIWNDPANSPMQMDTDEYALLLETTRAKGWITVNVNEPPELAAAWVKHCNQDRQYDIRLWELGDELYGDWAEGHCDGDTYGKKCRALAEAMLAVDPDLTLALNLRHFNTGDDWSENALKHLADWVDIITWTFYPLNPPDENDRDLFASVEKYKEHVAYIQGLIDTLIPEERRSEVTQGPIGYNSTSYYPGPQTVSIGEGLWLADLIPTFASTGTRYAVYWAARNAYPKRGGDYGLVRPDADATPNISYHVLKLLREWFLGTLVEVESNDAEVKVHASIENELIRVIAVNQNLEHVKTVELSLAGQTVAGPIRRFTIDRDMTTRSLPSLQPGEKSFALAPYSLQFLLIPLQADATVKINIAPSARAQADVTARFQANFDATHLIDNRRDTAWASPGWASRDGSDTAAIDLVFSHSFSIGTIRLFWSEERPTRMNVLASEDGITWKTIAAVQAEAEREQTILPNQPIQAKRLRFELLHGKKRLNSTYVLNEIEVYECDPE